MMETYAYRIYVTDALYLHGQDKAYTVRWVDMMDDEPSEYDGMDGDEIAAMVMEKCGLTFGGE